MWDGLGGAWWLGDRQECLSYIVPLLLDAIGEREEAVAAWVTAGLISSIYA